jgi:hypothetical protein
MPHQTCSVLPVNPPPAASEAHATCPLHRPGQCLLSSCHTASDRQIISSPVTFVPSWGSGLQHFQESRLRLLRFRRLAHPQGVAERFLNLMTSFPLLDPTLLSTRAGFS